MGCIGGFRTSGRNICRMLGDGIGGNFKCISDFYPKDQDYQMHSLHYIKHGRWKRSGSSDFFHKPMVERNDMETEKKEKAYEQYVKEKTPVHNVYSNMAKAFVTGGTICVIGQFILNYCKGRGISDEISGAWTSLILVLLSVILTGFNVYYKIAKWGGAGALVPITGFANSVASPAIEYKKEGQVFGIGCKIFTIAGPVILYGIVTSWVLGMIYYLTIKAGVIS